MKNKQVYKEIELNQIVTKQDINDGSLIMISSRPAVGKTYTCNEIIKQFKGEYEYLYLDKEITVDRVFHKSRRKRFATYEVDKIEIMAPIKSYHLDGYKNRQWKEVDLSSRVENQPDTRYVFFYDGNQKIIFEPNEALVKCVKNVAPRKVFMD